MLHENLDDLTESLKSYINTNYELRKLETIERASLIGSGISSILIIGILLLFFLLFISLVAGFYLATVFGNNYSGFAIVAGFYFLVCLILYLGRKRIMEQPIREKIIRKILGKK